MKPVPVLIGVDAGGTKVRAAVVDAAGRLIAHLAGPGVNVAVEGVAAAADRIATLVAPAVRGRLVAAVHVGIAGGWSAALGRQLSRQLASRLGARRVETANDAITILRAESTGRSALLLTVGTGVVLVGEHLRIDGWGPLAGDAGSGYWMGRRALEEALGATDGRRRESAITRAVRRTLRLRDPGRDIHRLYADERPQARLAGLAPLVIRYALRGDPVARSIRREAAARLAETVLTGVRQSPQGLLTLYVTGGLAAAPGLLDGIRSWARRHPRRLRVQPVTAPPEASAVRLAARAAEGARLEAGLDGALRRLSRSRATEVRSPRPARGLTITEQANPASEHFSRLPVRAMVELMNREDMRVAPAVAAILPHMARAVVLAEERLRLGGRLVYVGAGTSGRLGVLDASEAPPTFGVPATRVRAVLAGGTRAIAHSVEGAEDRADWGAAALRRLRVDARDCVIGLSVSGGAQFVLGAIAAARGRGAATIGITANPRSALARRVQVALVPRVGPEVITGSSRLKAGTAQKMLLNMLSTCVFARLGRIEGNLMIRVNPANAKLRLRAIRIVADRLGIAPTEARRRLVRSGWNLGRVLPPI